MLVKCRGIVLRQIALSESDKLLTLLTAENGKITVYANGTCSYRSKLAASSQVFCYSDFVLYAKDDNYWVRETNLIENFFALREDVTRVALASYICEVADDASMEEMPEPELLRLVLNTLYAIVSGKYPMEKIKACFEIRAAAQLGFAPDVSACALCGSPDMHFLDVGNGCALCEECASLHPEVKKLPLSPAVARAISYIGECDGGRFLSFSLPDEDMKMLERTAETYLLDQVDRGFKTLNFYKSVL